MLEVRVGDRVFTASLTDLTSIVAPHGSVSGYVVVSGGPHGERNDLSLKNDFTFVLTRLGADEAAVNIETIQSADPQK
jgi:hypothetical protein